MQSLEELRSNWELEDKKRADYLESLNLKPKGDNTKLPYEEPLSHGFVFSPATPSLCSVCGQGRGAHFQKHKALLAHITQDTWKTFRERNPDLYENEKQETYKFRRDQVTDEEYQWYLWIFAAATIVAVCLIYINSRP